MSFFPDPNKSYSNDKFEFSKCLQGNQSGETRRKRKIFIDRNFSPLKRVFNQIQYVSYMKWKKGSAKNT